MSKLNKLIFCLLTFTFTAILAVIVYAAMLANKTISDLLLQNEKLKSALGNITRESKIGFAKVLKQEERDGRIFTTLKFVEVDRDDSKRIILEKQYEIEGTIIHFDLLIVRFNQQLVMDGKERSLYLWRRVYGEHRAPADGFPINLENAEPRRYASLLNDLPREDQDLFWHEIWDLAHNPDKLNELGVTSISGTVDYQELRPGWIYVFIISNAGALEKDIIPDI